MKLLTMFPMMVVLISCTSSLKKNDVKSMPQFIGISSEDPRYFSFSDGTPYVPIGINMINPSRDFQNAPDSALLEIETWMKSLSENGGNYVRVWLSNSFWDIEEKAGVYDSIKIARIDRFIGLARKYKLRIKLTLEHFRSLTLKENNQRWATKFSYHRSSGGPLDSISQYISTDIGRKLFLNKVDFYKMRYGADTLFFGWELWNEMNAMKGPEDSTFFQWNRDMLSAVKERFPENLVMQSLGSFDADAVRPIYKELMSMPGNEVAQVHRYLDLGASLPVCHSSMDIICSSAVEEILSYELRKPVLLAETGAVEPRHAGPSKYYPVDTAGILLHDIIFAPFFSGAAGTGMSWHWESYVHKNNLWYHYGRFNKVITGIDPIKEKFEHSVVVTADVRIYRLAGKSTQLLWLRDKQSTWETELDKHIPARTIRNLMITADELGLTGSESISVYDPWQDQWTEVTAKDAYYLMPAFSRSLVIRFRRT